MQNNENYRDVAIWKKYYILGLDPIQDLKKFEDITTNINSFKKYFLNEINSLYISENIDIIDISTKYDIEYDLLNTIYELFSSQNFKMLYESDSFLFLDYCFIALQSLVNFSRVFTFVKVQNSRITFCLIQHHKNLSIWFPELKLYIPLHAKNDSVHVNIIPRFLNVLFESIRAMENLETHKLDTTKKPMILLSYPRPYHFFVDLLPSYLGMLDYIEDTPKDMVYIKDQSFFEVIPSEGYNFESEIEINDFLLKNNLFLLKPVKDFIKDKLFYNDYYNWLIQNSHEKDKESISFKCSMKESGFLLWIGICSEKRNWIELDIGVRNIIDDFSKRKISLCVILDGMTRPELVEKDCFIRSEAKKDYNLALSIINEFPKISFINSVGMTAREKINLASKVDFFVTSFLTDSMYVARFAKKLGVAYGANVAKYDEHKHPKTFMLPKKYIKDVKSNSDNWSKTDYSIDPTIITSFCRKIDEEYTDRPPLSNLFTGKGFSVEHNESNDYYSIKPSSDSSTYISLNEVFYGFSTAKSSAYKIECNEKYLFRYEAISKKDSLLYIIAYSNGDRIFTERIKPDNSKAIRFPEAADRFRLLIRLHKDDLLIFYNVFWDTSKSSNCIWLSAN